MQFEKDEKDNYIDVLFNGDICSTCINEPNCTTIKLIQLSVLEIKDEKPIVYCNFYQNRTVNNVLYWFKKLINLV